MTLTNQKFITVNSKCYPYHNDGGTCFTSYEIAKTADFIGYESSVIIPRIFERKKTEFYKTIMDYFPDAELIHVKSSKNDDE